jgi:hypothetical protein
MTYPPERKSLEKWREEFANALNHARRNRITGAAPKGTAVPYAWYPEFWRFIIPDSYLQLYRRCGF